MYCITAARYTGASAPTRWDCRVSRKFRCTLPTGNSIPALLERLETAFFFDLLGMLAEAQVCTHSRESCFIVVAVPKWARYQDPSGL